MNIARFILFASLLLGAEVASSLLLWVRAPTDSIRVKYGGFWNFELGRLYFWVLVFGSLTIVWLVARHLLVQRDPTIYMHHAIKRTRLSALRTLEVMCVLGLEMFTSALYWLGDKSSHLRSILQSAWSWGRVPGPADLGWPSFFRSYLWYHLAPWAITLLIGIALWRAAR